MARYNSAENVIAEVGIAAKPESSTIRNLLDRFDKELELFGRTHERLDGAVLSILIPSESEPSPGELDNPTTRDSQLFNALEMRLNTLQDLRFQFENLIDRVQL